jgi:glycosyltransferase involved in cell wall biosynthesis
MTAPLRVAFCHFASDPGGGSDRSLWDFISNLDRERVAPVMLLRRGDPMAVRYHELGVPVRVFRLVPPRRAWAPLRLLNYAISFAPSVLLLAIAIRREGVAVVHVNTLHNLQGAFAAALAGRVPLVWHIRELAGRSRTARAMLGLVPALATRVVAISGAVAAELPTRPEIVRRIANGIDPERYAAVAAPVDNLGIRPEKSVVVCVGRLEPWKGQHVLLESFPEILKSFPDSVLLFVGPGAVNKPAYANQLRERAAELMVDDAIVFAGPREDIPAVLAATDVAVVPTRTAEPFGRTVVEAMAAGLPVVATDAGGPREIVLDGETGFLVPPGDVSALAGRIGWLLGHPEQARAMGQCGRERVRRHFALSRVVRELTSVLHEAAGVDG